MGETNRLALRLTILGVHVLVACGDDDGASGTTDMGTERRDMGSLRRDAGPSDGAPPDVNRPNGAGDLVITEIMFDPSAIAEELGEWVELHNPSRSTSWNLEGCVIGDATAMHQLDVGGAGLVVGPGGYVTLAVSATPGFAPSYVYAGAFGLAGGAEGDTFRVTCGAETIDEVVYGTSRGFPSPMGASLSLDPSAIDPDANDDPSRWCAATTELDTGDLGSPGAANPACPVGPRDAGPPPPRDSGPPPPDSAPPPPRDAAPPTGMQPSSAGAVVITEILYDPTAVGDADGEWFEIHNPSTTVAYDLSGCVLEDGTSMHTIGAPLPLSPGAYVTLARTASSGISASYVYADAFGLNNDMAGDRVRIGCGGTLIDEVVYSAAMGWPDPGGASLSLDPARADATSNDSPASWCAASTPFSTGDLGTPGAANPTCPLVTDAGPTDSGPTDSGPADSGPTDAGPTDAGPTDSGPADSGSAVPLPGAAGDLVISEILYDPEAMTPEGDFEWIEIHNPGTVARELAGCTIADASASGMHLIAPATGSLVVAAGDYVVLARSDTPGFTPDYSYAGEFTLNNTGAGDTVTLACGSAGTLIDQVAYSPDGGWVDPVGASLSLDPSRLDHLMNDSPASWCAATTAFATGDLGTPGMPNPACTTP